MLAPPFERPPHMEHPAGVRVWFIEPLGVVTQFTRPMHLGLDVVRFFRDDMDVKLRSLRESPEQKVSYVHDWRLFESYDTEARKQMVAWGLAVRDSFESLVVVLGPSAPTLVRMGINVAASALNLAGVDLRVESDLESVLRQMHARARDTIHADFD